MAIYRWAFYRTGSQTPYMAYVGKAEDLSRRIQDYLRGTKKRARRIKSYLEEEKSRGSEFHWDTLEFGDFSILMDSSLQPYELISTRNLNNPFIRKMMEEFQGKDKGRRTKDEK